MKIALQLSRNFRGYAKHVNHGLDWKTASLVDSWVYVPVWSDLYELVWDIKLEALGSAKEVNDGFR